jgi:hypothetical protein
MDPIRTDCKNDQTKSKYASLAAVDAVARPIYTRYGFSLSFDTAGHEKADWLRVVCKIHHAGGHTETASIDLPADGKGAKGGDVMTRTHAMGSAISYARRYLLSMIFSLAIEKTTTATVLRDTGRRRRHRRSPCCASRYWAVTA